MNKRQKRNLRNWKRPISKEVDEMSAQVVPEYSSFTIRAKTPTGSMFVTILENDEGRPTKLFIHVGKTGTDVAAWAYSMAGIINTALEHGASINEVISQLESQTSDRAISNGSVSIHSGAEGLLHCLMEYRRAKYRELKSMLDGNSTNRYPASFDSD